MPDVKLIISAEDQTKPAFATVEASAQSTFSAVKSSASSAFTGLSNAAVSAGEKIGSVFKSIQANWLAVASVVGSLMFLKNMAAQAYEAEIATNRLKIQIEGLGVAYSSVEPQVNSAIQATSKYAIVQEEEVASVLQKLLFYSGDVNESMKRLNLTYDFAAQKGIDVSQSADLIGKAMTGNVEMLGRYVPELRNLEETLGKNATEAEKTAYAFALLEEKSANAAAKMTENQRWVKEGTKAWLDLGQAIGGVLLKMAAYVALDLKSGFQKWKDIFATAGDWLSTPYAVASAAINKYTTTVGGAINNLLGYTKTVETETGAVQQSGEAHKKTEEEIALEVKARSDSIEAAKKQIGVLEKYAEAVKSLGADALKFAELDFTKNLKLPGEQIAEMAKSIADTEKMLAESAKLLSIEGVMENNSAAVKRHYELQKSYIAETNALREKEQSELGALRTKMDDYGSAIDKVYGDQLAKQAAIKTQLEQQKSLLESQKAKPQDISAAAEAVAKQSVLILETEKKQAEAVAKQSVLILETEKKQAEARLGLWQQYYTSVSALHTQAVEAQKQKTLELIALESQIAAQRQGFDEMQLALTEKAWGAQQMSEVEKYYNNQRQLEYEYQAALQLGGQQKIDALAKYQQQSAAAAKSVVDDGREYISLQTSAITALDQVKYAQAAIVDEQNKLTQAKQDEINKTIEWAGATQVAMQNAQIMIQQYQAQIVDLGSQIGALKLNIETGQATQAVLEIKSLIDSIPEITYKKIVYQILGEGSEIKPITEKIQNITTLFEAMSILSPRVTADFSSVTQEIQNVSNNIAALSDIHPEITADFSALYAGIAQAQAAMSQGGINYSWPGLQFRDLSFPDLSFNSVPSFAAGAPYVPRDMIAKIHKGEAIVPAQYNTLKTSPPLEGGRGEDKGGRGEDNRKINTNYINVGDIKIIATGQETPADLAKKLVKPIQEELRRLAQLQ